MSTEVNQGVVTDTAKLMMHRLIARQIRRDPTLVEKAKVAHARQAGQAHARQAGQFAGWPPVAAARIPEAVEAIQARKPQ
jgi:hypothetical protein